MIDLGTAQRLVGDTSFRETLLNAGDLAGELDDPERMARAAIENNRGFYSSVGTEDAERIDCPAGGVDRLDGVIPPMVPYSSPRWPPRRRSVPASTAWT